MNIRRDLTSTCRWFDDAGTTMYAYMKQRLNIWYEKL
jgi:uncharacterized protein YodC (DUF2158 family)